MTIVEIENILKKNHFTCLDILKTVYSPDAQKGSMYDRLMNGIQELVNSNNTISDNYNYGSGDDSNILY